MFLSFACIFPSNVCWLQLTRQEKSFLRLPTLRPRNSKWRARSRASRPSPETSTCSWAICWLRRRMSRRHSIRRKAWNFTSTRPCFSWTSTFSRTSRRPCVHVYPTRCSATCCSIYTLYFLWLHINYDIVFNKFIVSRCVEHAVSRGRVHACYIQDDSML